LLGVIRAMDEALRFYEDEISYIATQTSEPRTAVHGDKGRKAREARSLAEQVV